jgi:TatD DNase family protein
MLIDSHAHLDDPQFDRDRDEVIAHAISSGVHYILNVATDLQSLKTAIGIAEKHDFIYLAAGIHPNYSNKESIEAIKPLLNHPKIVAIGEIGLDYYREHAPKEKQQEVFRLFLQEAKKRKLPIIIHQREAQTDILRILKEEMDMPLRGVMHCFSGDAVWAKECIKMGFFISFAGNLTYPKASNLREAAKEIPIENMLIETDCPWLAPQEHRGKRCEPAFVKNVAEELASIKKLSVEDIARITQLNFKTLFKVGKQEEKGKIAYPIRDSIYLNITNRCTSECVFCVKNFKDYVKGHYLRLEKEPDAQEIISAIGDLKKYKEVVFCGYGEPTLRLDVIKDVSKWVKSHGVKVRIDTNGHGNLINKRSIAPELKGIVDSISVSLNAETEEKYEQLCRPAYGKKTFDDVKRFIIECKDNIPEVSVTVLDMPNIDLEQCRKIASELGVGFRLRKYDEVG